MCSVQFVKVTISKNGQTTRGTYPKTGPTDGLDVVIHNIFGGNIAEFDAENTWTIRVANVVGNGRLTGAIVICGTYESVLEAAKKDGVIMNESGPSF